MTDDEIEKGLQAVLATLKEHFPNASSGTSILLYIVTGLCKTGLSLEQTLKMVTETVVEYYDAIEVKTDDAERTEK